MASITSIVKTADWILSRPTLAKVVVPVAKTFCAYAGYREMGLKYVFLAQITIERTLTK